MSNIIQVPLTHERDKFQSFDMDTCKRSQFQINRLLEISNKPEFKQFVPVGDEVVSPDYKAAFVCMWYDHDNKMHAEKIGRLKIL